MVRISRLERITNLVLALLDAPRPISLREIGTQVAGYPVEPGALRQAFERDKRTLRDGGIPVHVERVDGDDQVGYQILPEEYYLPDLALAPEEEEALAFALQAVRVGGAAPETLLARFAGAAAARSASIAVLPELAPLADLHEAIRVRAPVALVYHGRTRLLGGYGLCFVAGRWYLVARELHDEAGRVKTFRVDRIEGVPRLGDPGGYEVPEGFDVRGQIRRRPPADAAEDAESFEVLVAAREGPELVARLGPDSLAGREDDGRYRLRAPIGDEEALVRFLLGYGDALVVVGPDRLVTAVTEALETRARR